jgi:hypothetical protein
MGESDIADYVNAHLRSLGRRLECKGDSEVSEVAEWVKILAQ